MYLYAHTIMMLDYYCGIQSNIRICMAVCCTFLLFFSFHETQGEAIVLQIPQLNDASFNVRMHAQSEVESVKPLHVLCIVWQQDTMYYMCYV